MIEKYFFITSLNKFKYTVCMTTTLISKPFICLSSTSKVVQYICMYVMVSHIFVLIIDYMYLVYMWRASLLFLTYRCFVFFMKFKNSIDQDFAEDDSAKNALVKICFLLFTKSTVILTLNIMLRKSYYHVDCILKDIASI